MLTANRRSALVLYGARRFRACTVSALHCRAKGGHGSSPEICIDPITAGVHVHFGTRGAHLPQVPAAKEVALTVGKFAGGRAANVIPAHLRARRNAARL